MNPRLICALLSVALAGLAGCDKTRKDPVAPKVQPGSSVTPSTSSAPGPVNNPSSTAPDSGKRASAI